MFHHHNEYWHGILFLVVRFETRGRDVVELSSNLAKKSIAEAVEDEKQGKTK